VSFYIRLADRLSGGATVLAALIVAYMAAHIMLEIVLRAGFAKSTYVTDEFVGFAVAAATFLGLGHALRRGRLIRITLLTDRLPPALQRLAAMICGLTGLAVIGLLAAYVWRGLARDFTRGAVSTSLAEVPLWIPTSLVFAGLVVFLLQLVAEILRNLMPAAETGAR